MDSIPLSQFVARLHALYEGRQPRTRAKVMQVWRELEAVLGPGATTADLTTDQIGRWKALYGPSRAPWTLIGQLGYLRAGCNWAQEEGWIDRPPAWRRLRPKRPSGEVGPHQSRDELARLLAHLEAEARGDHWAAWRLYAAVATVIFTGLRRQELLCLRLEDLDFDAGVIWVWPHGHRLKTAASAQPVPMPGQLRGILRRWLVRRPRRLGLKEAGWLFPAWKGHRPWQGGTYGRRPIDRLRQAGQAVGIDPARLSWQSLRRSWATHAEGHWGLTDAQIQRVLRHTSPLTSRRHYRGVDMDNLRTISGHVRI